jgi:hypothetical protein
LSPHRSFQEPCGFGFFAAKRGLTLHLLLAGRCFGVSISGLSSHLLAFEFLSQFTLEPLLFAGFQKKGVLLDLFENALLLHLSLETPKGALNGFAVENPDFCQTVPPMERLNCLRLIEMKEPFLAGQAIPGNDEDAF